MASNLDTRMEIKLGCSIPRFIIMEEYKGQDVRYWELSSYKELMETLDYDQSCILKEFAWEYFQALLESRLAHRKA